MQAFLNKYLGTITINIAVVIGLWKLFWWIMSFIKMLWRQCCRSRCQKKNHVYRKYGAAGEAMTGNSWAVVTGGSDGIGLGMCKNLARQGFNICIISRSEQKINEKLEEIKNECRNSDDSFQTLCIVADFWKMRTIQEYRTTIGDKLAHLDVAVLCLNAGNASPGIFVDVPEDSIEKMVQINANHVAYLAKVMLKQLVERYETKKIKSAIVVTSSIASIMPGAGGLTYNATKTFATYIAEALNVEVEGKVDVMSYQPGFVATKMVGMDAKKPEMMAITPDYAAKCCFRDLGKTPYTRGAYRHEQDAAIIEYVIKPRPMLVRAIGRFALKKTQDFVDKIDTYNANLKKYDN